MPPPPAPPPREGSLRIAGYAALFDIADAARDTIRRGAFAATLARNRDPLPLYWQHDPRQRIGWVEWIGEDQRGLRVVARIDRPRSRAAAMLAARAVSGLSFGYRATQTRHGPQGRELIAVDLIEVSLVTHPLQHGARVHLIA
ncbi:HK97 family phage prohead protease [Alteriqipengyuania sp. 357]